MCVTQAAWVAFTVCSIQFDSNSFLLRVNAGCRVEVALRQLSEAEEELRKAQAALDEINRQFQEALASKRELEQRAQATKRRMEQANRLINGLAGEKARWLVLPGVRVCSTGVCRCPRLLFVSG